MPLGSLQSSRAAVGVQMYSGTVFAFSLSVVTVDGYVKFDREFSIQNVIFIDLLTSIKYNLCYQIFNLL